MLIGSSELPGEQEKSDICVDWSLPVGRLCLRRSGLGGLTAPNLTGGGDNPAPGHLGQEGLDHQEHAADVQVHAEVPVLLLTVQDGPVVDKPAGQ